MNQSGNIDPQHTADPSQTDAGASSQSEGTTYERLLCILFDLAVLKAYAGQPFSRFVYHDGVLETMDDRKKFELLALLKEFVAETGVRTSLRDPIRNASRSRRQKIRIRTA
jgi:uncharacterized protein YydD (DUF2326 family)